MASPLIGLSATEVVAHLERGETTSVEVVSALAERAEEVEGRVNALAHRFVDRALARAAAVDETRRRGEVGRLAGLPITVKESIDTVGVASTMGLLSRRDAVAKRDAAVVEVAAAAGAIVWAKTNVPQTLMVPLETTNELFGTTHNPWRQGHGPGGSSGGEGAALASGTSFLGIGTDIGGSIRFPAAFCGVAGLKPTNHRWANLGSNTLIRGQEAIRGQIGPMARRVDDLDLFLSAVSAERMADLDPSVPPLPYVPLSRVDVPRLRVGVYTDDGFLSPGVSVQRAVAEARAALEAAGVETVAYAPPNVEEVLYLYFTLMGADGQAAMRRAIGGDAVIPPLETLWRLSALPAFLRALVAQGLEWAGESRVARLLRATMEPGVDEYFQAVARRAALRVEELHAWASEGLHALLCPATVTAAIPQGMAHDFTMSFLNCSRYNLLDLPAGVVPVTRVREGETGRAPGTDRIDQRAAAVEAESAGLPVGVQIVGRPFREHEVLALMAVVERAVSSSTEFPKTPIDPR